MADSPTAAPAALSIAALGQPPAAYHHLFKRVPSLRVVDCWSDPHGWAPQRSDDSVALCADPQGLALLQARLLDGLDTPALVVLDSLSPLVDAFGAPAVCDTLGELRRRATGVIACLHADLHPRSEVDALCYGAGCVAELGPAGERPPPALAAHGRLAVRVRPKSGAVKADNLEYIVERDGGVTLLKPPPLEAAAPPEPSAAAAAAVATMRLEVTEEEAAARDRVQLPYEHQGQGGLYAPGVDFREYLPAAAGGQRQGQGRLGHILYVRDSDSEDPDSDEDPDDDLDV